MNNSIIRGTFRIKDSYTVFYEFCTRCKNMRCVMKSDLCNETAEFQTDYYPGRHGMSILESLVIDMERELIPHFEAMMKGEAPRVGFVSTSIAP